MKELVRSSVILLLPLVLGCISGEILVPEPTALDQDQTPASCPGLTSVTVVGGPSLSLQWNEATDTVTPPSKITYLIYLHNQSSSYDLVSPSKIVVGATSTILTYGIQVGNTYSLFVACKDEAGNVNPTFPTNEKMITVSDGQAPSSITDLAATNPTNTSILLTWSPSDDGTSGTTAMNMRYKVFAANTANVSTSGAPLATVTGTTSHLHSSLVPGSTWYYKVTALDSTGNVSTDSNEAHNSTLDDTQAPSFAGGSGLAVTGKTSTTISLSWNAASDNVNSASQMTYSLYRCSESLSCNPFSSPVYQTTAAGVTTFVDSYLTASTIYVYAVRAKDATGNTSTNSDSLVASTVYTASGSFYAYPTEREVGERLGQSVLVANLYGPWSGDTAYPDLIVGAPNASEAGSRFQNTGCVYIFSGKSGGLFKNVPSQVICLPNAAANGSNARNFGYAMATGDFDNDGMTDLVVTAPYQNKMFVYLRTENGLSTSPSTISYPTGGNYFGTGICTGNIDGTGGDDFIVTSPAENCSDGCGKTGTGNFLYFSNTSTGGGFVAPGSTSALTGYKSPGKVLTDAAVFYDNSDQLTRSCTIGKFDPSNPTQFQIIIGSGLADTQTALAQDNNYGKLFFYRITASNTIAFENSVNGAYSGAQWGEAVTGARLGGGSVELFVGAPYAGDANSGAVYSYSVTTPGGVFTLAESSDVFYGSGDLNSNLVGAGVTAADVNSDTLPDLLIGAPGDDRTNVSAATALDLGNVLVHLRSATEGVNTSIAQTDFNITSFLTRTTAYYSSCLAQGDVNNDGVPDLVVGSRGRDYNPSNLVNVTDQGAVYIYYGSSSEEMNLTAPSLVLYGPAGQGSSLFGSSCLVMDYNGDGRSDLLVGTPNQDVSGVTDRGVVYLFLNDGTSSLPSIPTYTLNAPTTAASQLFGYSLASGDWDGNGKPDLAIGAIGINSGSANSGRVYVYFSNSAGQVQLGSPSGVNPPATSANLYFGYSMTSYASTSGSTAADLVVCAPFHDYAALATSPVQTGAVTDGGICYAYQGSTIPTNGTSTSTATLQIRYPYYLMSSLANNTQFGTAITKGDWNGDGINDLVICANRQTNLSTGTTNAGACFAFFGKANGGFTNMVNYNGVVPQGDDVFYNSNDEGATIPTDFGRSIVMMDINNNGSPDLLVGEPTADNYGVNETLGFDSGRLFILRGGF